ncbi:hypothetical protein [uncultured Sphingomonas sp.]|uniref:hypothetical protein n=1 Tax=uncultured Sphingomonas sp. TaxID=158754 RepID=UPI0035CC3A0E
MILPVASLIIQTLPSAAPEPGSAISAVPRPCAGPSQDGEVVVCAHARNENRLAPLPPLAAGTDRPFDPLLFRLPGGASARVHGFQHDLPGATSQGAAVTFTVPLGRK